jgi:hypothetical protein
VKTFWEWLSAFRSNLLAEAYYTFNRAEYDRIFNDELERVIQRTHDPAHLQALEAMRGFRWLAYIITCVRRAGWHDQREIEERTHDLAVKLLTSTLFRGFDEAKSGPMDLRFKRSVANAIRNLVELERNRRRFIPTVPIQQQFTPGGVTADELPARLPPPDDDERIIKDFRQLVRKRLGGLGVAVLDARLAGEEMKSLADSPSLGSPGKNRVKAVVCQIKQLAREYALGLGDPDFLRRVERAMEEEEVTFEKRRAAMAARSRQGVGA